MEMFQRRCKLCSTMLIDENFEIIDNVVKDILKVILLKLNFDSKVQCVMCRDCSPRLYAAFNFKQMCLYSNNAPFQYLDCKKPSPNHFDQTCLKEERTVLVADVEKICRLCTQKYVKRECMSVQEVPVEVICIYFPEINIGTSKDAEICQVCFETLCLHSRFLKNCSDVDEQFYKNNGKTQNTVLNNSLIKIEEIEIKSELHEDLGQSKETSAKILHSMNLESDESNKKIILEDQNDKCDPHHEHVHKNSIEDHAKIEMDSSGVQMYNCKLCTYNARRWDHYSTHQLVHKDPADVQMCKGDEYRVRHKYPSEALKYRCDECEYETSYRHCLKNHQLRHKDASEVSMNQCSTCSFETKRKSNLIRHLLTHRNPSEMKMYKCSDCAYETRREYSFKLHESKHKRSSEVQMDSGIFFHSTNLESDAVNETLCLKEHENKCDKPGDKSTDGNCLESRTTICKDGPSVRMYSCNMCPYKTKRRSNFSTHQLKHKNPSEVMMYKCDRCTFETKQKSNLTKHQMRHKDPTEVKMYKCEKCDYKSIERAILKRHQQRYKHFSETQVHKCEKCPYESNYEKEFMRHLSQHEEHQYWCDQCEYVTNRRYNLKKHQLRHKDSSEVQMYKCGKCTYESKRKNDLFVHQLTHKDPSEEPLYKCGQCEFGTSRRIGLKRHQLQHKGSAEVKMYKCSECDYENKIKRNLKSHRMRHHNGTNAAQM